MMLISCIAVWSPISSSSSHLMGSATCLGCQLPAHCGCPGAADYCALCAIQALDMHYVTCTGLKRCFTMKPTWPLLWSMHPKVICPPCWQGRANCQKQMPEGTSAIHASESVTRPCATCLLDLVHATRCQLVGYGLPVLAEQQTRS